MTGVQDLLRYLRANPADGDVAAIATRFGVEAKLVELAMRSLPKEEAPRNEGPNRFVEALAAIGRSWSRLTANKVWFLIGSSVVAGVVLFLSGFLRGSVHVSGMNVHLKTSGLVGLAVFAIFPVVQFVALAKYDKCRYAILGGAAFSAVVGLTTRSLAAVFGIFAMYVFLACPVVVAGAYLRMRREGRRFEAMSRQELLERLLAVRAALSESASSGFATKVRPRWRTFVERNVIWIAFVFSLLETTTSSVALNAADPGRRILDAGTSGKSTAALIAAGPMVFIIFASIGGYLVQFFLGFSSPRAKRTLLVIAAYIGAYSLHFFNPYAYVTLQMVVERGWANIVAGCLTMAALIFVGTLSRQIYDNAALKARRVAKDPDTLMAEMIDLEWRLTPKSAEVTVMAVDVAGSTEMKREADPLITEWSFREYQAWVERVCALHGGKVESTAGDGAIVGFEDPDQAANAALKLQAGIATFNTTVNRMSEPFRLRIGLHTGGVQGELGDVQFTRVIDVAAHIESKAPVGGIAVSEVVALALGSRSLDKTGVIVDGHDLYVLSDPLVPT